MDNDEREDVCTCANEDPVQGVCDCEMEGGCPHGEVLYKKITPEGYFVTVWARSGVPSVGIQWGRLTGAGTDIEWREGFGLCPEEAYRFGTAIGEAAYIADLNNVVGPVPEEPGK